MTARSWRWLRARIRGCANHHDARLAHALAADSPTR